MPSDGAAEVLGVARKAAEEEAHLSGHHSVDIAQALDHAKALQPLAERTILEPTDFFADQISSSLDTAMIFFHRFQEVMAHAFKVLVFGVEQEAADFFQGCFAVAFKS